LATDTARLFVKSFTFFGAVNVIDKLAYQSSLDQTPGLDSANAPKYCWRPEAKPPLPQTSMRVSFDIDDTLVLRGDSRSRENGLLPEFVLRWLTEPLRPGTRPS